MRAHSRTWGLASSETTRMRAPVSRRPPTLGSPTLPAPTTRHCLPSSFRNIGNKLVTDSSRNMRNTLWQITRNCRNDLPGQEFAQLRIVVSCKEAAQVFTGLALGQIAPKQSFESFGHLGRVAAIADRARRGLMKPKSTADAKVICVHQTIVHFDFLSFDTDVGDPVLAAAIWAARYMQLQVLVESRKAFFEFLHEPARKALSLGDREFAEHDTTAGNRAAGK